jgi:hypothetical protein
MYRREITGWILKCMSWRCRSFDLLPIIADRVHLTQYTSCEKHVHVDSIDVPFLNTCLALARECSFFLCRVCEIQLQIFLGFWKKSQRQLNDVVGVCCHEEDVKQVPGSSIESVDGSEKLW